MSDDRILVVDELVAGYIPEVNILNGCNIEVRKGEFVGVIGPNGAGKSTVLKATLGQCGVRSGQVRFLDNDITGMKAHELVEQGVGCSTDPKRFPKFDRLRKLGNGLLHQAERF